MIPVMIVEDEFLVRVGLRSIVEWETHGFRVVADAASAEKGLELYETHRPHLILTDIRMAPMNGLEMMRRIRERDRDVHFIVISAYSEFQYAQEAIRHGVDLYLDKASFSDADLAETLERIRSEYHKSKPGTPGADTSDARLPELLASLPEESGPDMERWFAGLGLSGSGRVVAVCRPNRSGGRDVNLHTLSAILSGGLDNAGIRHALFHYKGFVVALLDAANPDGIRSCLDKICERGVTYIGTQLRCGISPPVEGALTVRVALNRACQACNNAIFACNRVEDGSSPPLAAEAYEDAVTPTCRDISLALQGGGKEEAAGKIGALIRSAPDYRSLEKALLALVLMMEGLDPATNAMELLVELMQIDDTAEIHDRLCRWVDGLELDGVDAKHHYINAVLQHIDSHLGEDLSLKALSAKFHISPNYLGKLFFQRTGTYLSGYVNGCRINEACELIRRSPSSIGEIGRMVGIDNPHYFSKLFKDKMGMSPQQYRSRLVAAKHQ